MQTQTSIKNQKIRNVYPLLLNKERLLIWQHIKGMWKNHKPDPAQELGKMRKEWDRN